MVRGLAMRGPPVFTGGTEEDAVVEMASFGKQDGAASVDGTGAGRPAKPRDSRARNRHIGGTQNFRDGLVRRAPAPKLGNPRLEREKLLPLPWHSRGIGPHGLGKSVVRLIGRRRRIHWYR
jgi:hypothetical protein